MLLLYPYNKLPFSATNYGREFFTFIFWTPIKWLSWLLINSHYYVLKKQVIFRRFIFSPHVKTQDVSMFGERECLGNSWSFLVGAAFSPPRVKMLRPGQKRMWKHSGCPAENFIFFFLSRQFTRISVKKKDFCWSIIIRIFNEWCSQNHSRDALLHKRKILCGGLERGKRSSQRRGERELASAF